MELLTEFRRFITREKLIPEEGRVVLACSGGVDSVVLGYLLHKCEIPFVVAHVNYGLRGEESKRDEDFVRSLCNEVWHVHFFLKTIQKEDWKLPQYQGRGTQAVARLMRFEFFKTLLSKEQPYLFTAHHADDVLETWLMKLGRGSGYMGWASLRVHRGWIKRPLWPFRRKQILHYATLNNIQYVEDSSNKSAKYLRNKVRLQLIPRIKQLFPALESHLSVSHETLLVMVRLTDLAFKKWYATKVKRSERWCSLALPEGEELFDRFFLSEVLHRWGANASVQLEIKRALESSGATWFTNRGRINIFRKTLYFRKHKVALYPEGFFTVPIGLHTATTPWGNFSFRADTFKEGMKLKENECWLQPNVSGEVFVRKYQAGDWFMPIGVEGKKKLSDFFNERGYHAFRKEDAWVMLNSANEILWVDGIRVDRRYAARQGEDALVMVFEPILAKHGKE